MLQTLTFPDYSDEELHTILKGIMSTEPRFRLEDEKYGIIACSRLGRQRGTVGFGNARAVRNFLEQVNDGLGEAVYVACHQFIEFHMITSLDSPDDCHLNLFGR